MGPASGDSPDSPRTGARTTRSARAAPPSPTKTRSLKLAGNQMDYDAVTSIYTHSLTLIKTAVGRS